MCYVHICAKLGWNGSSTTKRNIPLTRVSDNGSPTKIALFNVVVVAIVVYIFAPTMICL